MNFINLVTDRSVDEFISEGGKLTYILENTGYCPCEATLCGCVAIDMLPYGAIQLVREKLREERAKHELKMLEAIT